MIFTLATSYDRVWRDLIVLFGLDPALYILALWLAWAFSRRKWSRWFTLAVVWGVVFPFLKLFSNGFGERNINTVNITATVVTAAVLFAATRSWIPAAGCAAGWAAMELGFECVYLDVRGREEIEWALSLLWIGCVVSSLMTWGVRCSRKLGPAEPCAKCGFDLRGVKGKVCPACGKPRSMDECVKCGYDLRGLPGETCPECGVSGNGG